MSHGETVLDDRSATIHAHINMLIALNGMHPQAYLLITLKGLSALRINDESTMKRVIMVKEEIVKKQSDFVWVWRAGVLVLRWLSVKQSSMILLLIVRKSVTPFV